jgi:NAD(P)-dependent dehydrogenase (short-subunit alcohol dehydrogenase family)
MDSLFDIRDKVAVITGGSGILCGAIAHGFAQRKAKVAVLGRTAKKVAETVLQIEAGGGEALALVADVLDEDSLQRSCEMVLAQWGRIDILINGAGGNIPGAAIAPSSNFFEHPIQNLEQVFTLNFQGTVLPTQVFGKPMAEARSGSIINISSMTAQQAVTRVPGYSTAKAAVDCFTRWLAVEVALKFGQGIRVNAIAPGFFVTDQNRRLLTREDGSFTERGSDVIRKTPVRRFGEAEELLGTAVWLASEASGFVTGTVIPVDGGFSAWSGV